MIDIGICSMQTHYTVQPVELARWAEENGFESLFFGEHSHVPAQRETPFVLNVDMPEYYREISDQFVCMTAAAAVTERLKIGTSVCLVPEHHPIMLAKACSCVDLVSGGRFVFGVGAGWSAEELRDHGVSYNERWEVTRERVLACREIWCNDIAEYHGRFVDLDPLYCWPKPTQPHGPPVLIGANASPKVVRHIVEYADGWIPLDGLHSDLESGITAIAHEAEHRGRSMSQFDLTVITAYELAGHTGSIDRIAQLTQMGFNRVLLLLAPSRSEQQWEELEGHRELLRSVREAGF
jgi:probable F420-dependent oxidoreductase